MTEIFRSSSEMSQRFKLCSSRVFIQIFVIYQLNKVEIFIKKCKWQQKQTMGCFEIKNSSAREFSSLLLFCLVSVPMVRVLYVYILVDFRKKGVEMRCDFSDLLEPWLKGVQSKRSKCKILHEINARIKRTCLFNFTMYYTSHTHTHTT